MVRKFFALILFGIAFGYVEAVVVVYLRQILRFQGNYLAHGYHMLLNLGFIAFVQPSSPVLQTSQITRIETFREFATIVMLLSISYVVGKTMKQKLGAFFITFTLWDIFYYVFLRLLIGWPKTLFDTDVYFLIPTAWVGPVITPITISSLLFVIGILLFIKSKSVKT